MLLPSLKVGFVLTMVMNWRLLIVPQLGWFLCQGFSATSLEVKTMRYDIALKGGRSDCSISSRCRRRTKALRPNLTPFSLERFDTVTLVGNSAIQLNRNLAKLFDSVSPESSLELTHLDDTF
ncbi:hypothetical protein DL93DRAFT_358465 [Clavulina sp. PMI_390]|nr:hypothetical protein DL93DRAFT_358465 [Clavulina sp. PMI_390]